MVNGEKVPVGSDSVMPCRSSLSWPGQDGLSFLREWVDAQFSLQSSREKRSKKVDWVQRLVQSALNADLLTDSYDKAP